MGGNPIHGSDERSGIRWRTEVEDVVVRRPILDDAEGVASLIVARDRADFGEDDPMELTGDELRNLWASRRAGLGLLLLQSGFVALRRRGHTRVGLEVDSENETGATRLYERAGMAVTRRYATYEKALA